MKFKISKDWLMSKAANEDGLSVEAGIPPGATLPRKPGRTSKASPWDFYRIWRRIMADSMCRPGEWIMTSHTVIARTPSEANKKTKRMFSGSGFTSMSLVAMPLGVSPNLRANE